MGYKRYLDGSGHRGLADYTCKPTQRAGGIYSPPVAQRAGGHAGVQEGEHGYYNDFAWAFMGFGQNLHKSAKALRSM